MNALYTITLAGLGSLLLFAALLPSLTAVVPAAVAQTNATTTTAAETLGLNGTAITLSDQPFAIGHYRTVSENTVNNTIQISVVGNTTITLPNSTETVTTNDTANVTITFTESGGATLDAQLYMTTEDGTENATVIVTEFFSNENSPGIGIASFGTNSTGKLAALDSMVAITLDEDQPDGSARVSFFEWIAGPLIDNNDANSAPSNSTDTANMPQTNGTAMQ